ncbi:DegQ family serine endoprotease [Yunchengibacter salinarum]|uniref:DegQ family serine endoprotease n=1 Tax=Yunchengibacter salinarum TaxID=3133399 RepID=UPI0035B580AF
MLHGRIAVFMLALWAVLSGSGATLAQSDRDGDGGRRLPQSNAEIQLSYGPLVKKAAPAVVNIYTRKVVKQQRSALFNDPLFRRFFGDRFNLPPEDQVRGSLGSGVIVRDSGVIITNHHVVDGADEIRVLLADRREFDAEVVLADDRTDLAVLRIDTGDEKLPTLSFANSDAVQVGDLVLAIGNPFGIGQTVTSGIVSASARTQKGISDFGFFIQTDAAINPGNSGGALVDMRGRLLGVNTAIFSKTGTSSGIGFAIPANMVRSVLRAALSDGTLERPWLGVAGQTVTNQIAGSLGLDRAGGVLVDRIYPGSPAAKAGIKVGDVILAVAGKEIVDEESMRFRVATHQSGEEITLGVFSEGALKELSVPLATAPEDPSRNETKLSGKHPFNGVAVANLSPATNEELHIDPFLRGVIITAMARRSPAAKYGFFRPGDIILAFNGEAIERVSNLEKVLAQDADRYSYRLRRGNQELECLIVPDKSFRCRRAR